ncbi:PREDICTED: protein SPIRAL1-like 3 [Camelina sativa]|uniref:Protein SPIRAL1-like 3 n=1 Tax=Camelina sativa TaxID=90675 RepID=A0ABM0VZI9_CAMSA|nr:PREDICTED: protein SPIRAL1-like 3 [Camelina sativa]XP_010463614.1 PREDICTED: protein SPIRAL1-like 3 [Camelina sativa]
MGKARGVNNGVNESSLGYLFGSGQPSSTAAAAMGTTTTTTTTTTTDGTGGRPITTTTTTVTDNKKTSAGVRGSPNNYFRSEGQNCGNFLTERPSTKVHAAPGGGSSLGYLFGGSSPAAGSGNK